MVNETANEKGAPGMLVKTSDLTRGERLLVARRRRSVSQVDAADDFGVSLYLYRQWETDTTRSPHELSLRRLADFEACLIMRRRTKLSASKIAKRLGVSRWWFCQMERGEVDSARLVTFWLGV